MDATVGRIVDLAITIEEPFGGEFPPVTLLVIRAGSTNLRLRSESIADWSAIERGNAVLLDSPRARLTVGAEKAGEVYLRRDVLDKQILDISQARMVRVNDVFLTEDGPVLRAAAWTFRCADSCAASAWKHRFRVWPNGFACRSRARASRGIRSK